MGVSGPIEVSSNNLAYKMDRVFRIGGKPMKQLSEQEVLFFKEEGYLIKRQIMDPKLMTRARERMWANAPAHIRPDAPDTWIGPTEPYRDDHGNVREGIAGSFVRSAAKAGLSVCWLLIQLFGRW